MFILQRSMDVKIKPDSYDNKTNLSRFPLDLTSTTVEGCIGSTGEGAFAKATFESDYHKELTR